MNQKAYQSRINNFREKFLQEHKRRPSDQEIIDGLKLKDGELQKYYDMIKTTNVKRFSDRINDDDDSEFGDTIENVNVPSPSLETEQQSTQQAILNLLNTKHLTLRQKEVIKMYFGLGGKKPMTLEEIGEQLELTRERVRGIREQALQKLRKNLIGTEFEDLYNDLNN